MTIGLVQLNGITGTPNSGICSFNKIFNRQFEFQEYVFSKYMMVWRDGQEVAMSTLIKKVIIDDIITFQVKNFDYRKKPNFSDVLRNIMNKYFNNMTDSLLDTHLFGMLLTHSVWSNQCPTERDMVRCFPYTKNMRDMSFSNSSSVRNTCRICIGHFPNILFESKGIRMSQVNTLTSEGWYSKYVKPYDSLDSGRLCGSLVLWSDVHDESVEAFCDKLLKMNFIIETDDITFHAIQAEHTHIHVSKSRKEFEKYDLDGWHVRDINWNYSALEMRIMTLLLDIRVSIRRNNAFNTKHMMWNTRHPFDLPLPPLSVKLSVSEHVWNAYIFLILIMGHGFRPDTEMVSIDSVFIFNYCVNGMKSLPNYSWKCLFCALVTYTAEKNVILFKHDLLKMYCLELKLPGIPIFYEAIRY